MVAPVLFRQIFPSAIYGPEGEVPMANGLVDP